MPDEDRVVQLELGDRGLDEIRESFDPGRLLAVRNAAEAGKVDGVDGADLIEIEGEANVIVGGHSDAGDEDEVATAGAADRGDARLGGAVLHARDRHVSARRVLLGLCPHRRSPSSRSAGEPTRARPVYPAILPRGSGGVRATGEARPRLTRRGPEKISATGE